MAKSKTRLYKSVKRRLEKKHEIEAAEKARVTGRVKPNNFSFGAEDVQENVVNVFSPL